MRSFIVNREYKDPQTGITEQERLDQKRRVSSPQGPVYDEKVDPLVLKEMQRLALACGFSGPVQVGLITENPRNPASNQRVIIQDRNPIRLGPCRKCWGPEGRGVHRPKLPENHHARIPDPPQLGLG